MPWTKLKKSEGISQKGTYVVIGSGVRARGGIAGKGGWDAHSESGWRTNSSRRKECVHISGKKWVSLERLVKNTSTTTWQKQRLLCSIKPLRSYGGVLGGCCQKRSQLNRCPSQEAQLGFKEWFVIPLTWTLKRSLRKLWSWMRKEQRCVA